MNGIAKVIIGLIGGTAAVILGGICGTQVGEGLVDIFNKTN